MKRKAIERRGFRPVFLPVSVYTQRNLSCLAILRDMDTEEMISELLFSYLRESKSSRPCYSTPALRPVKHKRYLLYTKISQQLRREYCRKKEELQRFLLGVVRIELDKLSTCDCLCGCGELISPFINPETRRPQWYAKPSHALYRFQEQRPREEKYIALLREHGPISISVMSKLTGETPKVTANFLSELSLLKLIQRVSVGVYAAIPWEDIDGSE